MPIIEPVKRKVSKVSRDAKLKHFYDLCKGGAILDAGVSAEYPQSPPTQNYFLKNFRFDLKEYTGLGVGNLSGLEAAYPEASFTRYCGQGRFPFNDKQFEWVFSNAVIEHVGDEGAQLEFLNEMLRVGRKVFFTTPNKYFPIEAHTNVFLLHWSDSLLYWWCNVRKKWWTEDNLRLLSLGKLRALIAASNASHAMIHHNRLFGVTMTFTVICDASDGAD
jgi:SAM-dependent methyltransferase